jgi:Leucine-rich repeat (LRR) protein
LNAGCNLLSREKSALDKRQEKPAMKTDVNTAPTVKKHPVREIRILLITLFITMIGAGITAQVVMGGVDTVPVPLAVNVPEDVIPQEDVTSLVQVTEAISERKPLIIYVDTDSPKPVSGKSIQDILIQEKDKLTDITYIDAGKLGITDISGIEACNNLNTLILWDNEISDISLLSALPNLRNLYLGGNRIEDISPLSNLPNLSELYIWNNEVSDLTPLSGMYNLTRLDIQNNLVTDLSPLSNLPNLKWICVLGNEINDLSPLLEREIYLNNY